MIVKLSASLCVISSLFALASCDAIGDDALTTAAHTHSYGEWTTVQAATCTAEGLEESTCRCGEKETRVVDAAGHSFNETTGVCSVCGRNAEVYFKLNVSTAVGKGFDIAEGGYISSYNFSFTSKTIKVSRSGTSGKVMNGNKVALYIIKIYGDFSRTGGDYGNYAALSYRIVSSDGKDFRKGQTTGIRKYRYEECHITLRLANLIEGETYTITLDSMS